MINCKHLFATLSILTIGAFCSPVIADDDKEKAPKLSDEVKKAAEAGKASLMLCAACHGMDGKGAPSPSGTPMAPNLFDSELVKMDAEVTAVILLKGIKKEDMTAYNGQMMMGLGASMDDATLANLVTFIRSEYGKKNELTTDKQIAEWKKKHSATAQFSLTRDDLAAIGKKAGGEGEEKKGSAKK